MKDYNILGKEFDRRDSSKKVTGKARYASDNIAPDFLYTAFVKSTYAHAKIKSINIENAKQSKGVRSIILGSDYKYLTGSTIVDRPIIAIDKVRYYGEIVAIVVANTYKEALAAAKLVEVKYEKLKVINSIEDALRIKSPLVHENVLEYKRNTDINPKEYTNISNKSKIRKGNIKKAFEECDLIIQETFNIPQSDHVAMETRSCIVEITQDNEVIIETSSQAPFTVQSDISTTFGIDMNKITVKVPFVGGGFGGKVGTNLEFIGYIASKSVDGKRVKVVNSREEDMTTSPLHIGLKAKVKLGCLKNGKIKAAKLIYYFDGGAYSDRGARISIASACDCTGPYNIENVYCNSYTIYTNHIYATAFRGFGHGEFTLAIERSIDILSQKLNINPLELRLINSIKPGDTSPTQQLLTTSNLGSLSKCISKLSRILHKTKLVKENQNKIISTGISCFWKNSTTPTNAGGGAIITFNSDASVNVNCPIIEIGQGTKSNIAQIVAQIFLIDIDKVKVIMEVNTDTSPYTWKTAASRSMQLVGKAVLTACDDAIKQIRNIASIVLRCDEDDLNIENGKVYLKSNEAININLKDIVLGYTYENGNSIGGQIIGRGSYVSKGLTKINQSTGKGNIGTSFTVGAQAIICEVDISTYQYKILKAITVIDAGKVINPKIDRTQITGGMNMGINWATKEGYIYDENGIVKNNRLRLYRINRYMDATEYIVDFVEVEDKSSTYGTRSVTEHGIIGIPAALANCISNAVDTNINFLPITPQNIWESKVKNNESI